MNTKTYRLPKKFADDHWDRDCGVTDVVERETSKHYYVKMDLDGYRDMLSDADYYRDFDRYEGFEWAPLASSARATYAALKKAGAPGEDAPEPTPQPEPAPLAEPTAGCGCDARWICADHVEVAAE